MKYSDVTMRYVCAAAHAASPAMYPHCTQSQSDTDEYTDTSNI
jgi:hypothetical protein